MYNIFHLRGICSVERREQPQPYGRWGIPGALDGFGVDKQAVPVKFWEAGVPDPSQVRDGLHCSESTPELQSDAAS
jgi:hypothetical protein